MSTTTKLTEQQSRALDAHKRSVALAAGAGCGKTFVLTERFLSYLDPRTLEPTAELDELVAITFTDAAAREMRDRIRKRCYQRLTEADAADEQQAWRRLLRILDTARISTIHSLCGALLRNHAAEAGLDPRFEQLDAASADLLRLRTLDERLRQLLLEREEAVIQLATRFGLRNLREHLLGLLGKDLGSMVARWQEATPDELVAVWKAHYAQVSVPQAVAEVLNADSVRALQWICATADFAVDELRAHCERILALLRELPESEDPLQLLEELHILARVQKNAAIKKNWSDDVDYERFKNACKAVREDVIKKSILYKPWNEEQLQETARTGLSLLALAADVAQCYELAKQQCNVLDYDDLMHKAHRLLTAPTFSTARKHLAESTKLLLVDEFQDTDPVQVELVKSLCGDTWAGEGLFVVGDAKQSIYRFRGAQPAVSRGLREQLPDESRLSLTTNFRSQGAVLDFVNALFCDAFDQYEPLVPNRQQLTPLPAIEFLWAIPNDSDDSDDDAIPVQLKGAQRERYREARYIARRLAELIDSGESLVVEDDSLRPVKQGDVAILLRSLSDVHVYEEALREQGLDYYLAGGHAFYAQQEIYDVLHLLRSVSSPADELSLAGALRSPLFAVEDETIFWLVHKFGSLHKGLASSTLPQEIAPVEQAKVAHAARTLRELRTRKEELLVAEFLTLAIELTGYDATLRSEFLGKRKLANLHKLVEQARTLDKLNPGDLSGFVTQLSEFVTRDPKEPVAATTAEGDVIRIMTIHHAKGLEFPIVVIPNLERKRPGSKQEPIFDDQLGPLVPSSDKSCVGWNLYKQAEQIEEDAERLRLLYVACTRAADILILSSSIKDLDKPPSDWLKFLAGRFDLATGKCLSELPAGYGIPQIQVTTIEPMSERKPASHIRGEDLLKLVEKTRQLADTGGGVVPEGIRPIPVHHGARQSFSFSRLSGKLEKVFVRDESVDREEAIEAPNHDPREFGTLVHEVLEQIFEKRGQNYFSENGSVPPSSVLELCKFLAPSHLQQKLEEAAAEAAELVLRFLKSARCQEMTSARCLLREVEFILPGKLVSDSLSGRYLEGVIDCLYQDTAGDWHLLDYKTNRVTAAEVPAAAQNYAMQMFVYSLACERALGVRPVENILYFLRPAAEHAWVQNEAAHAEFVQEVCRGMDSLINPPE